MAMHDNLNVLGLSFLLPNIHVLPRVSSYIKDVACNGITLKMAMERCTGRDGAGARVKQCLRADYVRPNRVKLHKGHNVVNFLQRRMNQEHAACLGARRDVHKFSFEVKIMDVNRIRLF